LPEKATRAWTSVVALVFDVGVEGEVVAHGLLAATGDHHGFGLTVEQVAHVFAEVLDDDLDFLADVVGVEAHPAGQGGAGFFGVYDFPFGLGVGDLPGGAVGGVVAQHVEDEAFFDRLPHGIEVEGLGLVVVVVGGQGGAGATAKQF
jgi:hypothetical protein